MNRTLYVSPEFFQKLVTEATEKKDPFFEVGEGIPVVVSKYLPVPISYDACDIETKLLHKIFTGEVIHFFIMGNSTLIEDVPIIPELRELNPVVEKTQDGFKISVPLSTYITPADLPYGMPKKYKYKRNVAPPKK